MKKKSFQLALVMIGLFIINSAKAQKSNYISIETGFVFAGPANKLNGEMKTNGFGDYEELILLGSSIGSQYPKKQNNGGKFLMRYGRMLRKTGFLEVAGGLMQHFTVKGYDKKGSSPGPILGGSYGNYLSFNSKIYQVSANYIFTNQKQNAGIGLGPSFIYYQLNRAFSSENSNNYSYSKKYSLPGASVTFHWNYINGKWLFLGVLSNLLLHAPVKIEGASYTDANGNKSQFKETKVGGVIGDISLSIGLKF